MASVKDRYIAIGSTILTMIKVKFMFRIPLRYICNESNNMLHNVS